MTKLIFAGEQFEGQTCVLAEGKTSVGRAPDSMLIIEDSSVSAQHCHILVYGQEVIVRDAGSTNGTWVNGYRVRGQTAVQNGQTIRFGSVEARLELPPRKFEEDDTEKTAIYLHARLSRQKPTAPKTPSPTIIKPRAPRS